MESFLIVSLSFLFWFVGYKIIQFVGPNLPKYSTFSEIDKMEYENRFL